MISASVFGIIVAFIAQCLLLSMGLDYVDPEIGHGLHPYAALTVVAGMLAAQYTLVCIAVDRYKSM
jgi:hypothetical protein